MINILYISYNTPKENMDIHLRAWKNIPDDVRKQLRFIVIDDCSPLPVKYFLQPDFPINLTIARIDTDIYWNTSGAKNLGFAIADNDWVFSSDIDHIPEDFEKLITWPKIRTKVYLFQRHKPDGSLRGKNTSNIFIIHKEDFWNTGGYDEDLAGAYGHDEVMTVGDPTRPEKNSMMKILGYQFIWTPMKIIEYKEYETGDHSYKLSTAHTNLQKVMKKQQDFAQGKYRNGAILRFNWHIEKDFRYEDKLNISTTS